MASGMASGEDVSTGYASGSNGVVVPAPQSPLSGMPERSHLHTMYRSLTVHGASMALAMIRGLKPGELRRIPNWKPGWYNLHVGLKNIDSACQQVLDATWTEAPMNDFLPRSAIYGRVYLGRMLKSSDVVDPWILSGFGEWFYVIEETEEFISPVVDVRGQQGVWYLKDAEVQLQLQCAIATAVQRKFVGRFESVPDARKPKQMRLTKPWTGAKRGRVRSDLGKRAAPTHLASAAKRRCMERKPLVVPRRHPPANLQASVIRY